MPDIALALEVLTVGRQILQEAVTVTGIMLGGNDPHAVDIGAVAEDAHRDQALNLDDTVPRRFESTVGSHVVDARIAITGGQQGGQKIRGQHGLERGDIGRGPGTVASGAN